MEFKGLKREYEVFGPRILERVRGVLSRGEFILGEEVAELERELADYAGVRHCISCANATDGLILALMALGISSGDAVFTPDFSYVASAGCVSILGAVPVFVDIERETFNMSPDSLDSAIRAAQTEGLRCKGIIAVDLFGLPCGYEALREIADRYSLPIIEDGAQGFGGTIGSRRACSFGDVGVTSFFPAKPLGAYGDGGALFTDDDALADKLWSLRSNGRSKADKYENVRVGFNSRLDTVQAAILLEKLGAFDRTLETVGRAADSYNRAFRDIVEAPTVPAGFSSSWAQYTITTRSSLERATLQEYLRRRNIPSQIYYGRPLHMQPALQNGRVVVDTRWSQYAAERVLSLPIHAFITEDELALVIDSVKEFYEEWGRP